MKADDTAVNTRAPVSNLRKHPGADSPNGALPADQRRRRREPWIIVLVTLLMGAPLPNIAETQPPTTAPAVNTILEAIVARRNAIPMGAVQYEYFEFDASRSVHARLRDLMLGGRRCREERHSAIRSVLGNEGVKPRQAHRGDIYFDGGRARSLRVRIEGFAHEAARLRQRAEETGARAVLPPDVQDTVIDVRYPFLAEMIDGEQLLVMPRGDASIPDLREIDITFQEWGQALKKEALKDQTISAFVRDGNYGLRYATERGENQSSRVEYEFNPSAGFAPTRVCGVRNGREVLEILYGYSESGKGGVQTPDTTLRAEHRTPDLVRVGLWLVLVTDWSRAVDEEELRVPLNRKCHIVDRRGARERIRDVPDALSSIDIEALSRLLPAE